MNNKLIAEYLRKIADIIEKGNDNLSICSNCKSKNVWLEKRAHEDLLNCDDCNYVRVIQRG